MLLGERLQLTVSLSVRNTERFIWEPQQVRSEVTTAAFAGSGGTAWVGWFIYGEGREIDRSCTINSFAYRCSCIHTCAVEAMCTS